MFRALIFLTFFVAVFGECPEGSVEHGKKCYHFYKDPLPFVKAEQTCNDLDGHLVSIDDRNTNAFLVQQTNLKFQDTSIDFWIGATALINANDWSWTDGTNFKFSKFRAAKTDNTKNCATLSLTDRQWNTVDCLSSKPYVCKTGSDGTPLNTVETVPSVSSSLSNRLPCPRGWTFYERLGDCYLLTPKSNWSSAEDYCIKLSSHLTSIHTFEQIQYIFHLDEDNKWIGLYKFSSDKTIEWKWVNNALQNFLFWGNQGISTCAWLDSVRIRSDLDCAIELRGVCQKPAYS